MCIGHYDVGDHVIWTENSSPAMIIQAQGDMFIVQLSNSDDHGNLYHVVDAENVYPYRVPLLVVLRNMRGDSLPGFESEAVFRVLVSEKIAAWSEPSKVLRLNAAMLMHETISRVLETATPPSLPSLRTHLKKRLGCLVDESANALEVRMQEMLAIERERPYTQRHYYSDSLIKMRNRQLQARLSKLKDANGMVNHQAMLAVLSSFGVGNQSAEEAAAIEIEFRLAAYLKVVSKRIVDEIPKAVDAILVEPVLEGARKLQTESSDSQLEGIMVEDASMATRRTELQEKVHVLKAAIKALQELFQNSSS